MIKNTTGQYVYFAMVSTVDGSGLTGLSPTGYVSLDGGAQAGVGGAITEVGNGQYKLACSQGDTNGDEIGYLFTGASAVPASLTVFTDTKKVGSLNDIAAGAAMTLAADAITASTYDESTAFPIKSADTGSTQIARTGADGDTLESLSDEIAALPTDSDVTTACGTALSNIHLDHLLGAAYAGEGTAGSVLKDLLEDDSGTYRFTANALEQAPGATGDATEAKQDTIITHLTDVKGTGFVKDTDSLVDLAHTGADGDTLETLSDEIAALPDAAAINAEVDTAIETYHLDHLLAVDYDPASKPGVATALLNELVENDGGLSRFTANALEEAPSGTGGDASEANQTTIITHLTDIKGTGFVKDTDSLVDLAHIGADSDTLEALSDQLDDIATNLATVDGIVDNILVDTGTTLDGKIDTIDGIVDVIEAILEGDHSINTATTPWRHLIKNKTTAATLVEKELFETDGTTDVTATTQVVGAETEPA